jgi:hypothetical protein
MHVNNAVKQGVPARSDKYSITQAGSRWGATQRRSLSCLSVWIPHRAG